MAKNNLREPEIQVRNQYINRFFKRAFDFIVALVALLVSLPITLIVAIVIKCYDRGPIFFRQQRVGKNGRLFIVLKFRSMVIDAEKIIDSLRDRNEMDSVLFKIKNDPRITPIGRFIRKYSIDELPQLINILSGSMSIVGPRPALKSEVEQYTEYQKQRLLVKQGLTCYWQCSGRNNLTFEQQVELDIKYVKRNNVFIDLWIMLKTIPVVLFGKGC